MKFGRIPLDDAEGAVLAHAVVAPGLTLRKGRLLTVADVASLRERGVEVVTAARFEQGEVPEDEAAARLGMVVAGDNVRAATAFTGRVNLFATRRGVLTVDRERVDALNARHESVTLATLPAFAVVEPDQMVATVKIIPFAAPSDALADCQAIAAARGAALVGVAPFRPLRYRLVQTALPGTPAKVLDKASRVTAERVARVGGALVGEGRCDHDAGALAAEIGAAGGDSDVLLVVGASAITDRRDVLPAGIEAAGGRVLHFGMPVDPGNLLLLAELGGRPALGLPGCARSPKLNGFDWVLERLAAGLEVGPRDLTRMGVGGLLTEIPTRPQPRAPDPPAESARPRIGALVLAAGRSRRMGERNKLLIEVDGRPMVRHAAEAALEGGAREVVVVTGHERDRVEAALEGLPVRFAHNPDHALGLSGSLRVGLGALDPGLDGALVCLGDMPKITAAHLRRLIAAFDPAGGASIVVPTHRGKRGNPVLWARSHFPAMRERPHGDVGAKHLIGDHEDELVELELGDEAPLVDVDTPEALARLAAAGPVPA